MSGVVKTLLNCVNPTELTRSDAFASDGASAVRRTKAAREPRLHSASSSDLFRPRGAVKRRASETRA
jgi:hypothetical protein